ncbi:MAG: hypothetical protein PF961_11240 [Planctomycetota bacterium]|jgi:hypothetical protein|nr:hypothetical protein [Planctomycetota bacterium]
MDPWHIETDGNAALATWCRELPTAADNPTRQIVHQQRNLLLRLDSPAGPVVAKRWRSTGLKKLLNPGSSKAERSYQAAIRLAQMGLPTPPALAWAQRPIPGGIESWYCCAARDDSRTLYTWTHGDRGGDHDWARQLHAAGALTARLHAAGVEQRDLTPGNLIVSTAGMELIDLNRIHFHPGPLPPAIRWRNLAMIGCGITERGSAVVAGYAAGSGLPREDVRIAYQNALRAHNRRWRCKDGTRTLRHALRRALREG